MVQGKIPVKKVLYISYDGMTDPLGRGQVLSYLAGLASKGHQVTLISFEKKEKFENEKVPVMHICQQAGIDWHPLSYTKTPPVLSTVYDIRRMQQLAVQLHRINEFDIVHCRGYIASIAGLKMKKKYGLKFIFDMRGFWIDEKCEGSGAWNMDNYLYRFIVRYLRKMEKAFYLQSDHIITLTQTAADFIDKQYPRLKNKITVIPTCVNLEVFRAYAENSRKEIRNRLQIPADAFVMLYSGGIGHNYDTGFLVKAFEHIQLIFSNAWLLVLSKDGLSESQLENKPQVVTASVPYTEVYKYLAAGDVGVINYSAGFSNAGRSPTKLGEYWACGLASISPSGVGDVDNLFKAYPGSGIAITNNNFSLITKEKIQAADKMRLRQYAEDYFGLKKGIELYNGIYNNL